MGLGGRCFLLNQPDRNAGGRPGGESSPGGWRRTRDFVRHWGWSHIDGGASGYTDLAGILLKLGSAKLDAEVGSLGLFGKTVQRSQIEVWSERAFASSSLLPRTHSPWSLSTDSGQGWQNGNTLSTHRQALKSVNHPGKGNTADKFSMCHTVMVICKLLLTLICKSK